MLRYLRELLTVPEQVRAAFIEDTVRKNRVAILAVGLLMVVMEIFNIMRVLAFSKSGLGTLNNRIYFTLYVLLLLVAAGMLLLTGLLWHRVRVLKHVYQAGVPFLLLWNMLLNGYDVISGHTSELTVLVTALLGLSVLIQQEPKYAIPQFSVCYLIFLVMTWGWLDAGAIINLTVTVIVSVLISVIHFHHVVQSLRQEQQIVRINAELLEEQEKLRLSLEQHRIIMNQASDIMFRWDLDGDRVEFSHNWTELLGYPREISNFTCWLREVALRGKDTADRVLEMVEAYREGKTEGDHEIRLRALNGEVRWYQVRITVQRDRYGRPVQGIGVLRDVSALQSEITRLQQRLQRDTMTGVLNRSALEAYANQKLAELPQDRGITMLVIDLDDFKSINDTRGHPCGDYVLQELARGMQTVFRKSDGLGRIGGDEFAAVLPGLDEEGLLREKAEQLMEYIRRLRWQGEPLGASCSIGAAIRPNPVSFQELYHAADEALYQAKHRGKNQMYILPAQLEQVP